MLLYQLSYNGEDAYSNKKTREIASLNALFPDNLLRDNLRALAYYSW